MAAHPTRPAHLRLVVAAPVAATPVPSAEPPAERELRISIWRDEWAQFIGSRAQLEAEGLIPEAFEWPRGQADQRWQANGYDYWLRRERPEGHKGPMRSWLELDNWFLRVGVIGRDYTWRTRRRLERKTEELRAEYHRHTLAGQLEWTANWHRYWQAREDRAFQAFKSTVLPARKKPGRKPKNAVSCI